MTLDRDQNLSDKSSIVLSFPGEPSRGEKLKLGWNVTSGDTLEGIYISRRGLWTATASESFCCALPGFKYADH
jgi:hypothetical protein